MLDANVFEGFLLRHNVAERDAVVVGSDFNGESSPRGIVEVQTRGVVAILNSLGFANWNGIGFIEMARFSMNLLHPGSERGLPLNFQA